MKFSVGELIERPFDLDVGKSLGAVIPIRLEALKYTRRFLKKLPDRAEVETVRMLELAAEIQLKTGDAEAAEKQLDNVLRLDNSDARKCDRDFPEIAVRAFKTLHGLLDPKDAEDEEQAEMAAFNRANRLASELIGRRRFAKAREQIESMEQLARSTDDELKRSLRLRSVLELYARVKDSDSVKRVFRRFSKENLEDAISYSELASLGLNQEAIRRAERTVNNDLKELANMDNPNIHFPADSLCDALEFMVDQGELKQARKLLKKVLSECEYWPVYEYGWTTSAVYTMLARAVAKIEGPKAATQLMESAYEDAAAEKRANWRKGATREAITLEADLGYLDEAIARARKLRSPRERRFETAKLLARARRWKELRDVCQTVGSPTEAAELCWEIRLQLPSEEGAEIEKRR